MLVPEFNLAQTDSHVNVHIRLPYVKVSSAQFYIEANMFKFYLKPYLLTLNFQQKLKEVQEPAKAVYFHQKQVLYVDLQKQKKGEYFENLSIISSLMSKKQNKKTKDKRVLVQVISEDPTGNAIKEEQSALQNSYSYGFCGNYTGVFKDLSEECSEIFMFDPSSVSKEERFQLSRKIVFQTFDQNAYMFDKVSNFDEIDRILDSKCIQKLCQTLKKREKQPYTFEKFKAISKIPKKEIIIGKNMRQTIMKQLISIALCYLYEFECMEGQLGVESPKTINNTSALLSCNVSYDKQTVSETIYDCCRRCVTFSLYKSIQICEKVCRNLSDILDKNFLLEVLLQLRIMFEKSEPRYLLNRIYIDDFCTYLLNEGQAFEKQLINARKQIKSISTPISEKYLDLELQDQQQEMEEGSQSLVKVVDNELQNLLSLD